jgi:pseudouridine-5'-monophosphatase
MNRLQSSFKNPLAMVIKNQIAGFKTVTHCIFDMDGLLLDTEKIYENIVAELAKKHNSPYPWDVRMKILGTTERRTCEIAVKELNLPCTVESFHDEYVKTCVKRLGNVHLLKGAERLVRHLYNHNIPIALATSSGKDSVEVKTSNHQELFDLFMHKVMGSTDPDVKKGKPAPDIFLVAASRFPDNPDPEDCLVFEDAPNGCKAAKSAGMQVVMVPDSHVNEEQKEDATVVYHSLLDFKPEEFGLPPFRDDK